MLDTATLPNDPTALLDAWIAEAAALPVSLHDAMALATATPDGRPSVRYVLYKGREGEDVYFYTNYESRKAQELDANPQASLLFWWKELGRQVRIEGPVARAERARNEAYFATRPQGSQLAATVSPQSAELDPARDLGAEVDALEARLEGRPVPCPEFWGGYRLRAERFEFWVNQEHRLHDRVVYIRDATKWRRLRLGA